MNCKHGRHNMKNSWGDSGGDVDKIFCLILYNCLDFGILCEKVRGVEPPHPELRYSLMVLGEALGLNKGPKAPKKRLKASKWGRRPLTALHRS